jgi:hypothetical protein
MASALPTEVAHKRSIRHRVEILGSEKCGCFHCLRIFAPSAIQDWCDERDGVGQTALCPFCGIDAVIGSASGYPVEQPFLDAMKRKWFG